MTCYESVGAQTPDGGPARCVHDRAAHRCAAPLAGPGDAGQPAPAPASAPATALKGTLERVKVHGKALEGNLMGESAEPEVSIYLPPSYAADRARRYPVVYLLHGYTGTDLGYFGPTGRQLHVIAERVFGAGAAKEMILVMPNCMNAYGGCMYSNSVTAGNWESYVADDLVAYVDGHYRTIPARASRGLAGHSMGGYGTLRIAMKRPDVFSAIYALSSCCLNEGTVRPPRDGAPSAAESIKSVEEARGNRSRAGHARSRRGLGAEPGQPAALPRPANQRRRGPTPGRREMGGELPRRDARSVRAQLEEVQGDRDGRRPAGQPHHEQSRVRGSAHPLRLAHTFETYEGDHNNHIPQRLEEKVLPFFSRQLSFEAPRASRIN